METENEVLENEGTVENPPVDTPPVDDSAPEGDSEPNLAAASDDGEPKPYEPNYKFNVRDKEHEMDDWAKGLLTNKETEDKLKELYAKSIGIETIQAKRDEFKTELDTVQGEYTRIKESLGKLSGFVQKGEIGSFLEATGISKDAIFDWVAKEIQYQEMPQEQRAQIDAQRQMQYQAQALAEQNQMMQTQIQQQAVAQKATELNAALSDPKVAGIAKAFDDRIGKPGAFREEVCKRGHYHFTANNQDVSAQKAIDEVIQLIGSSGLGQNPSSAQAPKVPQNQKPVLPHISAGSTSPVAKKVSSIADLKKRRDQLLAGG